MIKSTKSNFITEKLQVCSGYYMETWRNVDKFIRNNSTANHVIYLNENNSQSMEVCEVAEVLNDYFSTLTCSLDRKISSFTCSSIKFLDIPD